MFRCPDHAETNIILQDILKDIERKDMTYNRIIDKTNTSLIEFELGTGQVNTILVRKEQSPLIGCQRSGD